MNGKTAGGRKVCGKSAPPLQLLPPPHPENQKQGKLTMAAMPMRKLRLWQDKIETEVAIFGDGPPLVFLHGSWGLRNDHDFLELLARTHTVYAPKHPGTSEGDPDAVHQIAARWACIAYSGYSLNRHE